MYLFYVSSANHMKLAYTSYFLQKIINNIDFFIIWFIKMFAIDLFLS